MGGDRARQRAAGAVQVGRNEPRRGEPAHAFGGHEEIDRLVAGEMAALHQHGGRPKRQQRAPLRGHLLFARGNGLAEQRRRFGEIGRQAIDERQQPRLDRRDKPRSRERVAGGSDHDGVVDDEGALRGAEAGGQSPGPSPILSP